VDQQTQNEINIQTGCQTTSLLDCIVTIQTVGTLKSEHKNWNPLSTLTKN